jgi:hypothetical protein
MYHDIFNVEDYFVIQISPEQFPLKINHKFQVGSVRPFKVLQMNKSNSYVIKLPSNFNIISTFNMKDFVLYKIQPIFNAHFENPDLLFLSLAQKNILMLFWMHKLFLSGTMNFNEFQYMS